MNQEEELNWQLQSNDDKIILFNNKLQLFCGLLEDKQIDELLPVAIESQVLEVIKNFIESHRYESESIRITKPVKSNIIGENLDPKSVQSLNVPDELFDKILASSYYLNFDLLRQACLCILACKVYIKDDENDIERARKQFGLTEFTPEQEMDIMQKNKRIFEQLQKIFREKFMNFEEQISEKYKVQYPPEQQL